MRCKSSICENSIFNVLIQNYTWHGFRGSSFLWRLNAKWLKSKDGEVLCSPTSLKLLVNYLDWTSKTILQGSYERALLKLLLRMRINELYVDVGANIGSTLFCAMRNASDESQYLAIEPNPNCQTQLTLAATQLIQKGSIVDFALSDNNRKHVPFHGTSILKHSGAASLKKVREDAKLDTYVETRTLDSLIDELPAINVEVIKIDTEGNEVAILKGASKTLSQLKFGCIILEYSPQITTATEFFEVIEKLLVEYDCFVLSEEGFFRRTPRLNRISDICDLVAIKSVSNVILLRRGWTGIDARNWT